MAQKTHAVHLTDDNFEQEVMKHDKPVLVDFWAPWCAPCRAIAPIIEELAAKYQAQVKIGKLNVDDEPNSAGSMGIRSLPTMLLFKNGQVVEHIVGAVAKEKIEAIIKSHL
jgi:thioredoxin 1